MRTGSTTAITAVTTNMINLLIGPPGGGKSYEAVVYHILPALNAGRKVITNLPLDLERLSLLGFDVSLVEIRTHTQAVEPEKDWNKAQSMYQKFGIAAKPVFWVNRPFAHPEDYGHAWRHPDTGSGPLYVVDECHLALPRGDTKREVEEWFSLHRHESADVLLITQSYGKVSKSIIDLVQVCYRVKKGTAFGTATQYIRKVQDGVRGEVVNTGVRTYEKKYFGLYKSHTRGGGSELAANDIIPMWKRWPFIGAAVFLSIGVAIIIFAPSVNPLKAPAAKPSTITPNAVKPVRMVEMVNGQVVSDTATPVAVAAADVPKTVEPVHPYSGRGLHIVGHIYNSVTKITRYFFAVSQNGQLVSNVDSKDLVTLGYKVGSQTPCAVLVGYGDFQKWVICDAPQVQVNSAAEMQQAKGETHKEPSGKTQLAALDEPITISPSSLKPSRF